LLDQVADLLQNLTSQDNDGGCTVTDFGILGSGNVREDTGGGVDNVQKLSGGRQ
jgi:hypothetical protein